MNVKNLILISLFSFDRFAKNQFDRFQRRSPSGKKQPLLRQGLSVWRREPSAEGPISPVLKENRQRSSRSGSSEAAGRFLPDRRYRTFAFPLLLPWPFAFAFAFCLCFSFAFVFAKAKAKGKGKSKGKAKAKEKQRQKAKAFAKVFSEAIKQRAFRLGAERLLPFFFL